MYHLEVGKDGPCLQALLQTVLETRPLEVIREKGRKRTVLDLHHELLDSRVGEDGTMEFTLAVNHGGPSLRLDEWLKVLFARDQPELQVTRRQLLIERDGKKINPILAARMLRGALEAPYA